MTSQTSLAELLAVRISAPEQLNSPDFWSMGTLVRDDMAVTPNHVVADLAADRHLPLLLHFDRPMHAYELDEPQRELGLVMRQLPEWDLALIEFTPSSTSLASYLKRSLPADLYTASIPPAETSWESFVVIPSAPEGIPIRGIVEGLEMIEGIPYLRLLMTEYPQEWEFERWRGISGAPIVIEERLCGIVGRMHTSEPVMYALPATEKIGEQWRWQMVDEKVEIVKIPVSETESLAMEEKFTPEDFLRRLSPAASRAMARADELRRDGKEGMIYMEYMYIALAENPEDIPALFFRARETNEYGIIALVLSHSDIPTYLSGTGDLQELTSLPRLSDQLSAAFRYAYDYASDLGSLEIKTWHLLAGLLSVSGSAVTKALNEQGITLEHLLQFIDSIAPAEDEKSSDHTNADPSYIIPGLRNDQVGDTDLLNIEPEAMTLASVIAARDVSPPFSIGLFGEWGSGKTFFMREMERSINRLARDANSSNGASPYCTNIVQIWFNSWHYIDTDLWASLTSEIFEGLAGAYTPNSAQTPQEAMQRLIDDRRRATDLLQEARRNNEEADRKLQEKTDKLTRLESDKKEIKEQLAPSNRDIIKEAAQLALRQPEVKDKIQEAAEVLEDDGLKERLKEFSTDLSAQAEQLNAVKLIASSLGSPRSRNRFFILLGVSALLFFVLLFALPPFIASDAWRSLVAAVAGVLTLLAPLFKWSNRAMQLITEAGQSQKKLMEEAETARRKDLEEEKKRIEAEIQSATKEKAEAQKIFDQSEQALKKLNAAHLLADFIGERDKSDDYRKRLGVITNTRNDFERLSTLMKRVREQKPEDLSDGSALKELPKVDRVILYIDDLDRCPEARVVEVLQAVHLLLAFDPFVVVVGVDPRWLLRALKQHTRIFDLEQEDADGAEDYEHSHWHSTPMNYLEKIFQIPFSLRPMPPAGFDKLIDSLAAPMAAEGAGPANRPPEGGSEQPHETPEHPESAPQPASGQKQETAAGTEPGSTGEGATAGRNGGATTGSESTIPAPDPAEPASESRKDSTKRIQAAIPKHLSIEEWEREDMKKFHEFIPSPRALKRFVNIYRLLRTSVAEEDRRGFIGSRDGGGYRSVLLLLAIQTGHPEEAATIIQMLLNESRERPWWEFIESLRPRCQTPMASEPRPNRGGRMNAERWTALFRKLDAFKRRNPSFIEEGSRCGDFIERAPAAARYSFHSGRILTAGPERQPDA